MPLLTRRGTSRRTGANPPARLAALLLCALALALLAAPALAQTLNPYVFFIVVDTVRADHCSYAGYQRETTPNLDLLAQDATVFSNAESSAPWTLPSFASLLSGQHAFGHGFNAPKAGLELTGTVAEPFNAAGYETVSIQTNFFLAQLDSEFSEHHWYMMPTEVPASRNSDGQAVDKAIAYVRESSGQAPYFMFMGLLAPHAKYFPHSEYFNAYYGDELFRSLPRQSVTRRMADPMLLRYPDLEAGTDIPKPARSYYDDARVYVAAYDSEIAYSDEQVGRLLAALKQTGIYDQSLIIVTSDHGEAMTEGRTFFTHGQSLYQREVHVPLLVKLPYQTEPRVVDDYVSTLDIFPTVFDYMNLEVQGQQGSSLLPLIYGYGEGDEQRRDVVSYLESGDMRWYSLIDNGYKLIKSVQETAGSAKTSYQLYNLGQDPGETTNLAGLYPDLVQAMDAYLTGVTSASH